MISTAAIALIVSIVLFLVLFTGIRMEKRRGRRFFGSNMRAWLDTNFDKLDKAITATYNHFIKYILQLNWYYSIHSLLRTILQLTIAFYTYFENLFERNRSRTKQLRAEKRKISRHSHLGQVAEYKAGNALTTTQKTKLRHKKLEERH